MRESPIPAMRPENAGRLFTLEVTLVSGPMRDSFLEDNPVISRTIQIRGDQTLEALHDILFTAFDREDDNPYEFRLGRGPRDPQERCYVLPSEMNARQLERRNIAGDVTRTRMDSLGLAAGQAFSYWFDFEDEWIHQVTVTAVDSEVPRGRFPRIISQIGESPSQYADQEEREDEDMLGYAEDEEWNLSY